MNTTIPSDIYKLILEYMPRPCVDIFIRCENKILLMYRNNEPDKNTWCWNGGLIFRGETIEQCAKRKCKEEIGIDINVKDLQWVGAFTYFHNERQDVAFTYVLDVKEKFIPIMDKQHSKFQWFSLNDLPDMPIILKETISILKENKR